MNILKIAWRNALRHTRRSIVTAIAISIGLGAMIYLDTMMNGVDKMASRNIIDFETSHLVVFANGYYKEENFYPLDTIIESLNGVIDKLQNIKGIKSLTPRIKFQCRINSGTDELPVLGIGVDQEKDQNVFQISKSVVKGSYLNAEDEILIGENLAQDMNLDIGSYLSVVTKDRNQTYNAFDFIVSGLINTGHPLFDRNAVIMPLETAQHLLAMEDCATEICIRLESENKIDEFKGLINNEIGNKYEVFNYKELNASIFEISGLKRSIQFLLALIVVIIAAVGIVNTMLMAVMERIPEIGTLKAMGFDNLFIAKIFLYEAGIIGIIGSTVGCIIGYLFSLHLAIYGLDFTKSFSNVDLNYPIKMLIKGDINYITIFNVFIFGIFVSIFVTLLPLRRAMRLEPVEALRYV